MLAELERWFLLALRDRAVKTYARSPKLVSYDLARNINAQVLARVVELDKVIEVERRQRWRKVADRSTTRRAR